MSRWSIVAATIVLPLLGLLASPAMAGLEDAINAAKTAAENAKTAANAAETAAKGAKAAATDAATRAGEAATDAGALRAAVQDAVDAITPTLHDLINEAIADVQDAAEEEMEARDAFLGAPADVEAFRQELIGLVEQLAALLNAMGEVDPLTPEVSFAAEIELIRALPAGALWPAYRAVSASPRPEDGQTNRDRILHLVDVMREGAAALRTLVAVIREDHQVLAGLGPLDHELSTYVNQAILAEPDKFRIASGTVATLSVALKGVGALLDWKGETGLVGGGTVGASGWADITLKSRKDKWATAGKAFNVIGDILGHMSTWTTVKIRHAMVIGSLAELRENQREILANQQLILDSLPGAKKRKP